MAWLHTWSSLLLGWVLFFMFVTGTFGYVNAEVDRWMRPELPLRAEPRSASELLPAAEAWLRARAADAQAWSIDFPGERGSDLLFVSWQAQPLSGANPGAPGEQVEQMLELQGGLLVPHRVRKTGGGEALYRLHYSLHYLPELVARYIVGICTVFMLVAIISGVIVHKKFFADFFTFRPGKGQRSWLDGHNLLSVSALPFYLMITWSGLIFFLFTYMPAPLAVLYPTDSARARFEQEAYGRGGYEDAAPADAGTAPLVPLGPLLAQVEAKWGPGYRSALLRVTGPGRANARVSIWSHRPRVVGSSWVEARFDGVSGRLLGVTGPNPPAVESFRHTLFNLHEGHFSGPLLRALYVLSALSGTGMVGTGLLLWSSKRKAKLTHSEVSSRAIALVDVLNAGTIIGLPLGIAAYFWANRLLPLNLEARAEWEMHVLFIAWAATFALAFWRSQRCLWSELCWAAAIAYGALPALNALTSDRHLGVTLPAGDWVLAGFDLCALAVALFFAFLARTSERSHKSQAPFAVPLLKTTFTCTIK